MITADWLGQKGMPKNKVLQKVKSEKTDEPRSSRLMTIVDVPSGLEEKKREVGDLKDKGGKIIFPHS